MHSVYIHLILFSNFKGGEIYDGNVSKIANVDLAINKDNIIEETPEAT